MAATSPAPADFTTNAETLIQWYDNGPGRDGRRYFKAWSAADGTIDAVFRHEVPDEFTASELAAGRTTRQFGPDRFFATSPSYDTCSCCGGTH